MEKQQVLIDLGSKVRAIRIAKGYSQAELANKIGKDHPSINKLENGKVNPSFYFLMEVAQGLEVDLKDFL